jgi:hypothetical protein
VPVRVGDVREGRLRNHSYMRLRVAPGHYVVDVNGATTRIGILGGHNHYVEVDLARSTVGLAAVTSNQRATSDTAPGELHRRGEAEAVHAMRGMTRVAPYD